MNRTEGALTLVSDYMKSAALKFPDKPAFIFRDQKITYQEFAANVERLACYLLKIGINKGDRIAYLTIPRPEFFYLYMAASRIGAIVVGIGTRHTDTEIEYILNNSEASCLFSISKMYEFDYQQRIPGILKNCPSVKHVVIFDDVPRIENAVGFQEIIDKEYQEFLPLLEGREKQVSTDDVLIIVYTSGSTGKPKGAMLTHRNIIHLGLIEIAQCGATPDDIWMNHLPMNHISGATEVGTTAIIAHSTQVLEPFNPVKTLQLIQEHKITILGQVPTMFVMEFALEDYNSYDLSSLRTVVISGAPAPLEVLKKIKTTMCDNCYNCLGLTELTGLITYTEPGAFLEKLNETVGKVVPEVEMKLVDKERREVPQGQIGEIAYRGTVVCKGYYKMPEANKASFDEEGWFYSGDLGFIDENGDLRLVGRSKEMYITGGENVYPAEIEEYIMRYPGVMLAACVAIPDEVYGEVGRAYIVPKPGMSIDLEDLKNYLSKHLAKYKIPREFVLRDYLPMTLLGKIDKKTLREEVAKEFNREG
ncbi:fatty-acyl-CoA synthase [Thermosyntropha lipolytica DSM 11003]|uniref:Fatty-acyl-CoA synthase n=1 Tax=Thermosyntropha lipolytica DSM 11003 TaxID=1123382 RepID=A0A1M5LC72_9FIRM|nr:class I adenylate-forming enzyme family protein [Thermosyntropha lipolytica]SHG62607.1 fatty-acyl-CoA synthase [Thermosyntropha lipolytica DSM 11003]